MCCTMQKTRYHYLQILNKHIRITCPCNVYPLTPHFYLRKSVYRVTVYTVFLYLHQNINCGYLLEPARHVFSKNKIRFFFCFFFFSISYNRKKSSCLHARVSATVYHVLLHAKTQCTKILRSKSDQTLGVLHRTLWKITHRCLSKFE